MRGGSWNNNTDNARAAYRNDNDPDNRNNNIGFRVVCSSHIHVPFSRCRHIALATAGVTRRKGVGWRGKVQSARRMVLGAGRIQKPWRRLGVEPRGALWFRFADGLANPTAEEAPDFGDHAADVFVLSGGKPAPVVGEAQVEAEFVEAGIGVAEAGAPGGAAAHLGVEELFGEVECGTEEASCDGCPVRAGEGFPFRDEPFQKIIHTRENDKVFHGDSIIISVLVRGALRVGESLRCVARRGTGETGEAGCSGV